MKSWQNKNSPFNQLLKIMDRERRLPSNKQILNNTAYNSLSSAALRGPNKLRIKIIQKYNLAKEHKVKITSLSKATIQKEEFLS